MESPLAPEDNTRKSPLYVLFLEDCPEDIELSLRTLRSANFFVKWDVAVTLAEFMERARTMPYDVILADYRMAGFNGMDAFSALRSEGIGVPFILVTGSLGDEYAVECLKQGVADFVLKDRPARLPVAIRRAMDEARVRAERIKTAAALKASEASYRSLIQSAPCGILRIGARDGCLLDANPALASMLGYDSPSDLLKARAVGLTAGDLSSLIADGGSDRDVECEVLWPHKDGTQLLYKLAGRVLLDDQGSASCLELIAENVSERRAAQQRIVQLNRLYTVLIQTGEAIGRMRDSRALCREICRIVVKTGGFQIAWLGMLEAETAAVTPYAWHPEPNAYVDGLEVTATLTPSGRGPVGEAIRENRHVICNDLAASPSMGAWRERALSQSLRSLAAFPIVNHGRPIGAFGIYASAVDFFEDENVALLSELSGNISFALESIEAQEKHDQLAAELHQFFALSLDMLCIYDRKGYAETLNPAWEKTLGFSAAELCSRPWVDFVHPEDRPRALAALAGFAAGVEATQLELRFVSKNGEYKWLVLSATPAPDRSVVFAAVSDITSQKRLEEQLRGQNVKLEERNRRIEAANHTKTEFLGNMSHELRSPLNGIIGFSELLYDGKLGGSLSARPREFVGRIHASASHLLQLINGLLDLSKIEAGHLEFLPEPVCVSQIIQEVTGVLSTLAETKHIRIATEIEEGVDEVTIDSGRLRQVLYNYLSNALKFTGDKGAVVVRLKAEGAADFRLEVSDTGVGVGEADIGRLFVEFQQLDATASKRYPGTGLGLAVTKRIVEAQGGRVGVASKLGEGSTFFAVLPRSPAAIRACDVAAEALVV